MVTAEPTIMADCEMRMLESAPEEPSSPAFAAPTGTAPASPPEDELEGVGDDPGTTKLYKKKVRMQVREFREVQDSD